MKIGELASASGLAVETIRFYERESLLPAPQRTEGNYRIYTDSHAQRLGFIRQCRNLDMTLDEVRVLLRFKDTPQTDCTAVDSLLDQHIVHVASRIQELQGLQKELLALRTQCAAPRAGAGCGIVQGLEQAAERPARATGRGPVRGTH